jgi:glycosyltransferase involved in cell wall biosynthesis
MKPPVVEIVMATYNGARWVDLQMASIVAQDYANWRLIIRDDASADETSSIIRAWRDRFPDRITILDEAGPVNLGLVGNFSALLIASSAPYVMMADWDDLWRGDKVSRAVSAITALEERAGPETPLLVHFDLRLVDANLNEIRNSSYSDGVIPSRKRGVGGLCLENAVHGQALIANRALVDLATPIPRGAVWHDWWIALVATVFGKVEFRPEVSVDWRRHGANYSATSSLADSIRSVITNPLKHRQQFYTLTEVNRQVIGTFLDRFGSRLLPLDRDTLQAFMSLPDVDFWARRRAIWRHRIFYSSWVRTLGLLLLA